LNRLTIVAVCAFLSIAPALVVAGDAAIWNEILTDETDVKLPAPRPKVEWLTRYAPAFEQAQEENRPLFVTFRCLPCKQCAEFDQDVLDGGTDLDPLLKQFVTVRVTNAEHILLNIFPLEGFQDLDLSWWGYFLSPEGQMYAVFGGKDHVSDSTRISTAALAKTMRRVLEHHYHPRREEWNIDGPTPELTPYREAYKLPGMKSWIMNYPQKEGCMHCHQVAEVLRQPAIDAGTFDKLRDTQVWPLPENVGITLARDHGLLVKAVEPGSAAAQAGIKTGDVLAAAGGRRLFGQADFRGVLHRGPKADGEIEVYWLRDGEPRHGTLAVKDGWRKTIIDWRMSVAEGNVGAGPGFFPLRATEEQRRRLGLKRGALAVRAFIGPNNRGPAREAGLKNDDLVVAVNSESPNVEGRSFLVWFRMKYNPGDEVTLTAMDASGKKRKVSYRLER
jgi:serine protease Do